MTGRGDQLLDEVAELADRIAATVTRCPDVAGLTQNPGTPVATYLPGRTVSGVAVWLAEVEICVVARYGPPLAQVAAQVRQAVGPGTAAGARRPKDRPPVPTPRDHKDARQK